MKIEQGRVKIELNRVKQDGHSQSLDNPFGTLVSLRLHTLSVNPVSVLERIKSIVRIVDENSELDKWCDFEFWRGKFPDWFVESFLEIPTTSKEEHYMWWERISRLPEDLKTEEKFRRQIILSYEWTFDEWIGALDPRIRQFFWYNGCAANERYLNIELDVLDWPLAKDAFDKICISSGASGVEYI